MRDNRIDEWKRIAEAMPWCGNCDTWDAKLEVCTKFNAKPPAKVIHEGCKEWIMNIPF